MKSLFAVMALTIGISFAAGAYDNQYSLDIERVIDGDTVVADVHAGFGIILDDQHIRLLGVDTPELRSRDHMERERARDARDRLVELVRTREVHIVTDGEKDSFGRILGDLRDEKGVSLSQILIREGFGVPYDG